MTDQIAAEIRKLRSTRSSYGLLAGMLAIVVLGVSATMGDSTAADLQRPLHEQFFMVRKFLVLFVLVLGIKSVTDEFRYGTVVPTLLATPQRRRVVAAKAMTLAFAGLVFTFVAEAFMHGLAVYLLDGKGVDAAFTSSDARSLASATLVGALWAVIGVGIATLVRHQVAAIVGAVFWVMFIEDIVAGRLGRWGNYLPANAGSDLSVFTSVRAATVAAALLGGWAAASWIAGSVAFRHRDVS
jgi:ABC-2 type transport system permease protein